jgi:hypothetical protein
MKETAPPNTFTRSPAMRMFARILGIFLLIEGIWGLFSPVVFGVLSTNRFHAVIHIILGILGIMLARRPGARTYLLTVGGLLAVVGILFFLPGISGVVVSLLNVNFAVACFNLVVGLLCIAVALSGRRDPITAST